MTGSVRDVGAGGMHHGSSHPRQHVRANPSKVQDDVLSLVSSALPLRENLTLMHTLIGSRKWMQNLITMICLNSK
jgi:hypothetical protein